MSLKRKLALTLAAADVLLLALPSTVPDWYFLRVMGGVVLGASTGVALVWFAGPLSNALAQEREVIPKWAVEGFGLCMLLLTGIGAFVRLTRFPS